MNRLLYLAYGSNLFPPRLRTRAPSARAVGRVELEGWDLRFHKRSVDGSGKCSLVRAAETTAHGVVYDLAAADRPALDEAEWLGAGYGELELAVSLGGAETAVFTYLAQPSHVDDTLEPYRWYLDLVVAGAREHGLPAEYVGRLEAVEARSDPDPVRAAENRRLLTRGLAVRRSSARP